MGNLNLVRRKEVKKYYFEISTFQRKMEQTENSCEVSNALKSIDLNTTKNTGCVFCQKTNPEKKCSKSHSRCKGKLFCDKNCEMSSHKEEKTKALEATAMADTENISEKDEDQRKLDKEMEAAAKAEKAQKKKAKKKSKKDRTPVGQGHINTFAYNDYE